MNRPEIDIQGLPTELINRLIQQVSPGPPIHLTAPGGVIPHLRITEEGEYHYEPSHLVTEEVNGQARRVVQWGWWFYRNAAT